MTPAPGVFGTTDTGNGVYGQSGIGSGVSGSCYAGIGVSGTGGVGVSGQGEVSVNGTGGVGVSGAGEVGVNGTGGGIGVNGKGAVGVSGTGEFPGPGGEGGVGVTGAGDTGVIGTGTVAGLFEGTVEVYGPLTKSGGGFKVDHPIDPASKYLYHSFVESSEMKNVYDGVVTLDSTGHIEVELPAWFEAVNRDFRYQLTPIGAPAPDLHIARKVSDGRFTIAGGQPGLEVSWQVTGVRKDAWAQANPLEVVKEKPPSEQGFYIHPELHGEPEEKGMAWAQHPDIMRRLQK